MLTPPVLRHLLDTYNPVAKLRVTSGMILLSMTVPWISIEEDEMKVDEILGGFNQFKITIETREEAQDLLHIISNAKWMYHNDLKNYSNAYLYGEDIKRRFALITSLERILIKKITPKIKWKEI